MISISNISSDDYQQVIKLIYHTDNYIYPSMCENDYGYFEKIMFHNLNTNSIFSYKNVIAAKENNEIAGIVLAFSNEQSLPPMPQNGEFEVKKCYEKVLTEFFQELIKSIKPNCLYINNLCVDKQYQNKGVGNALLQYILTNTKEKFISLDCLENNNPAIALYKKCGFKVTNRYLVDSGNSEEKIYCLKFEKSLDK